MASSSSCDIALVNLDDPTVRQTTSTGISNHHGIGFNAEIMAQVSSLSDLKIWTLKDQFEGIKVGHCIVIELQELILTSSQDLTWEGMIRLWIPVAGNPGVKDEFALGPNDGMIYKIPSLAAVGHYKDLIPEAAELFTEAFAIRDDAIMKNGTFVPLRSEGKKNAPGSKNQKFELAFPETRQQRSQEGVVNPGDMMILLRDIQTGDIKPFMPPQEKVNSMDFFNRKKVKEMNDWRDQVHGRKGDPIRYDRQEAKMWTKHEHYSLLTYVVRNAFEYCLSKGVDQGNLLARLNYAAVAAWCKENFSPQVTVPGLSISFVLFEIDKKNSQGHAQHRTLKTDRMSFKFTADEIRERVEQEDVFEDIMATAVDEHALQNEAEWGKFLLPEAEKGKRVRTAKPKAADKVVSGRVAKTQPKAKGVGAKNKGRGGSQDSAIDIEDEEASVIENDKENDDAGEVEKLSTPARENPSSQHEKRWSSQVSSDWRRIAQVTRPVHTPTAFLRGF